jgi:hypothetical protein
MQRDQRHPTAPRGLRTSALRTAILLIFLLPALAVWFGAHAETDAQSTPNTDEEEAQNPHGELEEACSDCHSAQAWAPAVISDKFNHARHGMALVSAHAQTQCMSCHRSLVFESVNPECVSCHQDVHGAELGTDCDRCHTVTSFIDRGEMTREHQFTRFPLRGAHTVVDCEECHTPVDQGQMIYVNRATECQSCHRDDYLATTTPDHIAAGFSDECALCHVALSWHQARMNTDVINHDGLFFPVFSGSHDNRWTTCDECHVSRSDYSTFSCILCHEHADESRTAGQHEGISGYRFSTADCFSCHPQGV